MLKKKADGQIIGSLSSSETVISWLLAGLGSKT
jgi:hypothetical protein